MNRGAQLLTKGIRDAGSQAALSAMTGLAQGYLSRLARAEREAGLRARKLLFQHCGIPLQSWDEPPLPEPAEDEPDTANETPDAKAKAP